MGMTKSFLIQWTQMQRKVLGFNEHVAEAAFWIPNTDIYDCDDSLVVKLELAGVPRDQLEIQLDSDTLIVAGTRRDPCTGETGSGYRFRQMEIDYGPFQRVIPLPYAVDGTRARTDWRDGILEIRLPRARARRAHRITIAI
jgi:HSP20 family protein